MKRARRDASHDACYRERSIRDLLPDTNAEGGRWRRASEGSPVRRGPRARRVEDDGSLSDSDALRDVTKGMMPSTDFADKAASAWEAALKAAPPVRTDNPAGGGAGGAQPPLMLHFSFCCGLGVAAEGARRGGAQVVFGADIVGARVRDFGVRFGLDPQFAVEADLFPTDKNAKTELVARLRKLVAAATAAAQAQAPGRRVVTFGQISPSCKALSRLQQTQGDCREIEEAMQLMDALRFDYAQVECVPEGTHTAQRPEGWAALSLACCEYGAPQLRPRAFWARPAAAAAHMAAFKGKYVSAAAALDLPPGCQVGSSVTNVLLHGGGFRPKRPTECRRPADAAAYTLTSNPPRLHFAGDARPQGTQMLFAQQCLLMGLPASFGPKTGLRMAEMRVGVPDGVPCETMAWWTQAFWAVAAQESGDEAQTVGTFGRRPPTPLAAGVACAANFCAAVATRAHPVWPDFRVCGAHYSAACASDTDVQANGQPRCRLCGGRGAQDLPLAYRTLKRVSATALSDRAALLAAVEQCAHCAHAVCHACALGAWQAAPFMWIPGGRFVCPRGANPSAFPK